MDESHCKILHTLMAIGDAVFFTFANTNSYHALVSLELDLWLERVLTEKSSIIISGVCNDACFCTETTFRLFCEKVGIDFEDRMLNWEDTPQDLAVFQEWMPWFEGVLTTNTFQPSATKPKSPMVMPDLPRHVQKAIDDNMPVYNKMYALRLRPSTLQIH